MCMGVDVRRISLLTFRETRADQGSLLERFLGAGVRTSISSSMHHGTLKLKEETERIRSLMPRTPSM